MSEGSTQAWPRRWELTAPESHVLSFRGGAYGTEPIRLAVTELVARGILRLEPVERSGPLSRKGRWALTEGPRLTQAVEPPLDVVLDLVRETRSRSLRVRREGSTMAVDVEGVLVRDLKRAVRKAFRPIDAYRERHVAPALVERGLLRPAQPRRRSKAAEFDWTHLGREADARLTRWVEIAREDLAGWVDSDPALASAFVLEAGSAVLLARDSIRALEELSRREGPAVLGGGGGEAFHESNRAEPQPGATLGQGGDSLNLDGLGGLDLGGLLDPGGLGDFGGGGGGGGGGDGGGGGGH